VAVGVGVLVAVGVGVEVPGLLVGVGVDSPEAAYLFNTSGRKRDDSACVRAILVPASKTMLKERTTRILISSFVDGFIGSALIRSYRYIWNLLLG
jgi:hypothetical protein